MKRLILAATVVGVATCGIVTVASTKKLSNVKSNTQVSTDKAVGEENDVNESKKDVFSDNKSDNKCNLVPGCTVTIDHNHSDPVPLGGISIDKPIEKPVKKPIKESTQKPQTQEQAKPKVEKPVEKSQIEKPAESLKNNVRSSVKDVVAEKIAAFKKAVSDGENLRVLYGSMGFVDSTYNSINDNFSSSQSALNENESKYVIDKLQETWNEYKAQNLD